MLEIHVSYPPFLKVKFVDQGSGHSVKILVGDMGVVVSQSPGNKELGKGEDITEVDDADDLDLEERRCVRCPYREQEVVSGGEDPPAEQESLFLVVQFDKLGILGDCCPIVLFFSHECTPFRWILTALGTASRSRNGDTLCNPPFDRSFKRQAADR